MRVNGNNLYGDGGELHKAFDNDVFVGRLRDHGGDAMVTYNSEPKIKAALADWSAIEWSKVYVFRRNNAGYREDADSRRELLLWNYADTRQGSLFDAAIPPVPCEAVSRRKPHVMAYPPQNSP